MIKLWVDDERQAPEGWMRAKSYKQAVNLIEKHDILEASLDHDLGDKSFPEKTGLDVLEFMMLVGKLPKQITFHTSNPVGKKRMNLALNSYLRNNVEK